ncbi:MAG TPA: DUF2203 family protein [Gemmataceae bacterium]|jgi:hypothetical protein|nr:DUF2203 family protein [Gemmataceae bacterium]
MKRNHNREKREQEVIRVWTHAQATAALPYLTSVMQSVRESRLEAVRLRLAARKLADMPGRPDRARIIAQEEAAREVQRADDRFQEAVAELEALDVYCLHAVRGQALIPFIHDEQLAWFVFDLFDADRLRFWRYHSDPLERRRPMAEALGNAGQNQLIV